MSELGEASVSDISNYLKITSTAHRFGKHKYAGYLNQNPDNQKYRLSIRLFEIGNKIIDRVILMILAKPVMQSWRNNRETVNLGILDKLEVVYIEKCQSKQFTDGLPDWGRDPAYCTGLGKALLACCGSGTDRYLAENCGENRNTIINPAV